MRTLDDSRLTTHDDYSDWAIIKCPLKQLRHALASDKYHISNMQIW